MRTQHIYKILRKAEWQTLQDSGVFDGSADDTRDGFIHLSCAHQLQGTLDKHYKDQDDVIVAEVDAAALGAALIYEVSRGGEDFPHLYGTLSIDTVPQHWRLSPASKGRYSVPQILRIADS